MTPLYLIAHKVRGEPTFDIAQRSGNCSTRCQPNCGLWPNCQDEEWWILPTGGWVCYPYWSQPLALPTNIPEMPEHCSDVFKPVGVDDRPKIADIIAALVPREKINRRV